MSDTDQAYEAVERLEYADRVEGVSEALRPGFDRRAFLRRTALTGVAAGSVSTILAACGSSASSGGATQPKCSARTRTTNSCSSTTSRPTRSSCPRSTARRTRASCWAAPISGRARKSSNVNQMVNAMNTAVTSGANGIAVALIDLHAFNAPDRSRAEGGHPGRRLQRRRARQRAPVLHRPGPETGG